MVTGFRKLSGQITSVILMVLFFIGFFYHQGFNSNCPFCIKGLSFADHLLDSNYDLLDDTITIFFILTEQKQLVALMHILEYSKRAPPV